MKLSEIKVGDKVRLKTGVEGSASWKIHRERWRGTGADSGLDLIQSAIGKLDLRVVRVDENDDLKTGNVCVDMPSGHLAWVLSEWLEPAEAVPVEAEPPATSPPDAIGLRLGGFVAVNRVTSIDLTADQLVELVATSFGSSPKAGTMSIGTTREEGVLKTFNLRWQEQAPGGDS